MADTETKVTKTADTAKAEKKPAPKKDKVKFSEKVKKFFREYRSEFKKISWPSKDETIKSTVIVLVSIVFCAIVIGLLDAAFFNGIRWLGNAL